MAVNLNRFFFFFGVLEIRHFFENLFPLPFASYMTKYTNFTKEEGRTYYYDLLLEAFTTGRIVQFQIIASLDKGCYSTVFTITYFLIQEKSGFCSKLGINFTNIC